jgi:hypothetical protein
MSTATASTALIPVPAKAPAWAIDMRRVTNYLVNDFGGGPRPWMPGRAKSDLSSFECSIEVPSSTIIIILHSNKKEEQLWRASN